MRRYTRIAPLLALFVLLSCASTSELVRRGQVALDSGKMDQAYDWSRRALDREPGNPEARQIMTAAASAMIDQHKAEVRRLVALDTLAAARAALELDDFHAQVARYRVTLPPDPDFHEEEAAILATATRTYYDKGDRSLAAGFPKRAYAELSEAKRFAPGDPDVAALQDRAWQEAASWTAILPFNDEVSAPELSSTVSGEVYGQLAYQLTAKRFRYTLLVSQDQVNHKLTVAQAGHLTREEAVSIGRAVGARRVVFGRIHDLRSDTNSDTYHESIYHKAIERQDDGTTRVSYHEQSFEAAARRRRITIAFDYEVLETAGGAQLAHDSQERTLEARTVFTRFSPVGSCDDYALTPPDGQDSDRERIEQEWQNDFGSWTLPALLDHARREPGRTRYDVRNRSEFSAAGTSTPVWLDELPPVEELAHIALGNAWMPMLDVLKDLDGKDDREIAPAR